MANRISNDDLWKFLRTCEDDDTLTVLHEFGSLMIAEVQARTAAIDAKATNMVGWNAAIAGVLLVVLPRLSADSLSRRLVVIGALVSLAGTTPAFAALRVRGLRQLAQAPVDSLAFGSELLLFLYGNLQRPSVPSVDMHVSLHAICKSMSVAGRLRTS